MIDFLLGPHHSFTCRSGDLGYILPLREDFLLDSALLEQIRDWRNSNLSSFFSQTSSSIESTANYLRGLLADSRHSFFLLITETGEPAGHLGYIKVSQSIYELDNLVRGTVGLPPDFIECAEKAVLEDLFIEREAEIVRLKVFANNILAKRIHQELGFEIVGVKKYKKLLDDFKPESVDVKPEIGQIYAYVQTLEISRDRFFG